MSAGVWTTEAVRFACPRCHASRGARCRTESGRAATAPHMGRLVDRFWCPVCGAEDADPVNVAHGYCSVCRDWTGDGRHTAAQDALEGL